MTVRELLQRSVPFEFTRAEGDDAQDDGRTLEGYAAVFDQETEIDSWEGVFTEKIRRGAFRKSIRENTPVMQFDHGRHPLIGSIPIGRIETLQEDDRGLAVTARLSENWLIEPVRNAIADRTVKGMSFRFEVIREEWRDNTGKLVKPDELGELLWRPGDRGPLARTLIELRVPELGPVVFPAYVGTSVDVRALVLAGEISGDQEMRREVRRSLASAAPAPADLSDPTLRRHVARALLFRPIPDRDIDVDQDVSQDAPPAGHSSAPAPPTGTDNAPPSDGHPSPASDAPPSDGHPSASTPSRTEALRAQIREITQGMAEHLASIKEP